MTAIHNEQTKLLATALDKVVVAYDVMGFVTPMAAASFGVASAPALRFKNTVFAVVRLCTDWSRHLGAVRGLWSMKA
ncbi:MAG: hypothetical protein INR70_37620 [Parafilimonas terrae]|nr:hypothetical protein [Parafilimonas terrae]